jgi:DNA-binding MarR family transcriptional regulator
MKETSLTIAAIHEIRDECLCFATQRAARLLARRFDRVFASLGLTNGQFSMLVPLVGPWRPRLGELAEFLAMDAATMTAAIKTLEKRGLVALLADEGDARARRPVLTLAGRNLMNKAVPLWRMEHAKVQAGAGDLNAGMLAQLGQ